MRRAAIASMLGLALVTSPSRTRADESPYLEAIPIRVESPEPLDLSRPLRLAAYVDDGARFAAARSATLGSVVEPDRVLVDLGDDRTDDAPTRKHQEPSFVIDFDEPSMKERVAELRRAHGEQPSIAQLIAFTDATITRKTRSKGFDLPSQVARHGEGDCTEHAVFLAAVARATGRPARVVIGTAVVLDDGALGAYGHAWTEIHDGQSWVRADAALAQLPLLVRYLRSSTLDREGPGYGMALADLAIRPKRIAVVGYAEGTPAPTP